MSEETINQMTEDEAEKMKQLRRLAFVDKMILDLEHEFPGFWEGADKQVRRNWVFEAVEKGNILGTKSRGEAITAIYMLAYLGLDFEQNEDYAPFVKYLKEYDMIISGKMMQIIAYIDWVVFNKAKTDNDSMRISRWLLRDILNYLPNPKRKLPEL